MYVPSQYQPTHIDEVKSFISDHGFAILVSHQDQLWATHLPLVLDPTGQYLEGHISKLNQQVQHFKNNQEVLAIFSGTHGYISSSWYEKEDVPTWNYMAVQVYGTVEILEAESALQAMEKLVDKYEATVDSPQKMSDWSEKTMSQIRGVIVFRIKITDIQAAYKLSQNKSETDLNNITLSLEKKGAHTLAEQMRKNTRK